MSILPFHKYQATANDFVLIDQRKQQWITPTDAPLIHKLCHRRLGIGADGLILLQEHPDYDFEMHYFNADGAPGSMCGNGGRCIVAFARSLGMEKQSFQFLAPDGPHQARWDEGLVALKMNSVGKVGEVPEGYVLDTGSPHCIIFVDDLPSIDVVSQGRAIRQSPPFQKEGVNVNFVQPTGEVLRVATYERGVEDETWSCGTGVTAAALAWATREQKSAGDYVQSIHTKGGALSIRYEISAEGRFEEVWLVGPAEKVFEGTIACTV